MVITYPDEVTHRAIIKTIKQLLDRSLPTGRFVFPPIYMEKVNNEPLGVSAKEGMEECVIEAIGMSLLDVKYLIQQNMEF